MITTTKVKDLKVCSLILNVGGTTVVFERVTLCET